LAKVQLDAKRQQMLQDAELTAGGGAVWRGRKRVEAFEVLALSQITNDRLAVRYLDLTDDLRALLVLTVPVACRPDASNVLPIANHAVLGFTYPAEAMRRRLPGSAFFQILDPQGVFHPNVDTSKQQLCLGATILANTPARELIISAFGALSMQTVQVNEADPAGVLNVEAARWWQQNLHRTPLTNSPFLAPTAAASLQGGTAS
jgi:hypothetical protein